MTRTGGLLALCVTALAGSAWLNAQAPAQAPPPPTAAERAVYAAVRAKDTTALRTIIKTAADANQKSPGGYTPLMDAASAGSLDAVKFLLDKGADANAQSDTGLTALMLADGDLPKQRLLLDRGANVNAATQMGRTALFIAALRDPSADAVKLLISRGADVHMKDVFNNTLLNSAAAGNDTETIRIMLDAGIDVNAGAVTGTTPIMLAAGNGNTEAVKLLIAKHANVNAVADSPGLAQGTDPKSGPLALHGYTPLLFAAANAPVDVVAALLDAGANVNATESRKLTPLMLAVASDHQDPQVIRLLLARGADASMKGTQVATAADWATKVGGADAIAILHAEKPTIDPPIAPLGTLPDPRTAVERGVAILESSSKGFYEKSGCVACHAQAMTDLAAAEARLKGARVDAKATLERQTMYDLGAFPPFLLEERGDILVPEIVAYSALGAAASGHPVDRTTDAMALNIAASQNRDGAWHQRAAIQERPGGEDGDIFRTALCLRVLASYAPPGRLAEMTSRVAKAREWLTHAAPVTAEDRNMQLLGLVWAGASTASVKSYVQRIIAEQQPDGGWTQHKGLGTDAYATGESLYALAVGGLAATDAHYQSGVRYLLATQRASDGSWRVASRTPKFQAFFQSGFPYAGDQWISQWATGWATMALAHAIETPAATGHGN